MSKTFAFMVLLVSVQDKRRIKNIEREGIDSKYLVLKATTLFLKA